MKKKIENILLKTNQNTFINNEIKIDLKKLKSNMNNKENNPNNENISISSNESKPYYHKIIDRKTKKYNNKNLNELSNFVNKLIKENNCIEEKIHKNINDDMTLNENGENNLIINTLNRRQKNKKINFNEIISAKKYSSTINIFPKNKNNELNKTIKEKKIYIPFPKKTKNKKQILERKSNYFNKRKYENNTYIINMNKILNSNNNNNHGSFNNIKKSKKDIIGSSNNLLQNNDIKSHVCFNNDRNNSFSYKKINEENKTKHNNNITNIKNNNMNKYMQTRNIINKNSTKSIFTFERLSKLKKSFVQNESNPFINKFINEDGTKDDINFKINKRKYLSPKISSKNTKIHFLSISKNKIKENEQNNYFSRIESNINYSKTLLNNIKLDNIYKNKNEF